MAHKINYLPVGVFTRTHGVQGALLLRLHQEGDEALIKKEWVFVEIDGLPVPFFIDEIRELHDDRVIISFDTIKSEDRAKQLVGRRLMISNTKQTRGSSGNTPVDLNGFRVIDQRQGEIGTATGLMNINENPVLQVAGEKEILIPYHPDIVLDISEKKKIIRVKLPEGLLDI